MASDKDTQRDLLKGLETFCKEHKIGGKGKLSVVLVITRCARDKSFPLREEDFKTDKGGQVKGLGGPAVSKILVEYGISRVLASEGGRTSRGSIEVMEAYLRFLNGLAEEGRLDLERIEEWWIARVQDFFSAAPLQIKLDRSKSLRSVVANLVEAAFARQKESPGMMVAGAVLQHLVGAKLELALPEEEVEHHGFSVADAPGGRSGDFCIADTAIHVTTAPSEALMEKCRLNLENGLRALIVTTESGVGGARSYAKNIGIEERIDILEIEQFVAANVYEWSGFSDVKRPVLIEELIAKYNEVVEECETDPSLKISVG